VSVEQAKDSDVFERLKTAMAEMQASHSLLLSDDLDPRVLTEFRDVLNRVRNVAWAAQQSVAARVTGEDPSAVGSLLAAERIRAAYQLCRVIQEDLSKNEIDFQRGQLSELHTVTKELSKQLKERL
jgi:spore coat polysaccharide biosynthesis protein SpsF (cytidylyltransferase family)